MPVVLLCEICGGEFSVDPYRAKSAKFCSSRCYGVYRSKTLVGEKSPSWNGGDPSTKCDKCGREMTADRSKLRRNEHNFCSWDLEAELAKRDRALAWLARELASDRAASGEGAQASEAAVRAVINQALAAEEEVTPDVPDTP